MLDLVFSTFTMWVGSCFPFPISTADIDIIFVSLFYSNYLITLLLLLFSVLIKGEGQWL